MMNRTRLLAVFALLLFAATDANAIDPNEVDDFQDGTTENWREGEPSPNPPTNISSGGPGGAGDRYLSNLSSGNPGPGGRMAMFNTDQWSGNYAAVGVLEIRMDLANAGGTPLHIRVGVQNLALASRFVSSEAFVLPADGQWHVAGFQLNDATMTQVAGTASLTETLASVAELRIISAESAPTWQGDPVAGVMGVDNIEALALPTPVEAATWGQVKALF